MILNQYMTVSTLFDAARRYLAISHILERIVVFAELSIFCLKKEGRCVVHSEIIKIVERK